MKTISAMIIATAALCIGCQQQQKSSPEKQELAKEAPPLHLGAVHQVFPEQHFALLRIIGPIPQAGSTLISHPADGSNERIGNLVISDQPARNGIIAADIRSGTVVKGDRVFQYRDISLHPGKSQEIPENETQENAEESESSQAAAAPVPTAETPDAKQDNLQTEQYPGHTETSLPLDNGPLPASKPKAAAPAQVPDYLQDIPNNINDWD